MGVETQNPFESIEEVAPARKGDSSDDLGAVQSFLRRFGYITKDSYRAGKLDESTSDALRKYQRANGRRPLGYFNKATRSQMTTHRCGLPDMASGIAFATQCAWDKETLTFAFDVGTPDVGGDAEFQAVRDAFRTWEAVIPLSFYELDEGAPDILIGWRPANDPDLDMRGGTLAHADFPPGCSIVSNALPLPIHFDDTEHRWALGAVSGAFDVETVALHEIGHALGLAHSSVPGSVMFPSIGPGQLNRTLTADDIAGIRQLYP